MTEPGMSLPEELNQSKQTTTSGRDTRLKMELFRVWGEGDTGDVVATEVFSGGAV